MYASLKNWDKLDNFHLKMVYLMAARGIRFPKVKQAPADLIMYIKPELGRYSFLYESYLKLIKEPTEILHIMIF